MPGVEKWSVSLSADLAEMVREAVAAGGYTSNSEVIREALRDWKAKQAIKDAEIERLRQAWADGEQDMAAGRYITATTEDDAKELAADIKKRGREKLAAHHSE